MGAPEVLGAGCFSAIHVLSFKLGLVAGGQVRGSCPQQRNPLAGSEMKCCGMALLGTLKCPERCRGTSDLQQQI